MLETILERIQTAVMAMMLVAFMVVVVSPGSVTTDDYTETREKYRMFNAMMQNGMQFYMLKPDVNRLVDFLKNNDNDELFKQAVLNRLIKDQETENLQMISQGALARGRMDLQSNESVFENKDLLEQEQLRIVNESDVLEKWTSQNIKTV